MNDRGASAQCGSGEGAADFVILRRRTGTRDPSIRPAKKGQVRNGYRFVARGIDIEGEIEIGAVWRVGTTAAGGDPIGRTGACRAN